MTTRTYTLSTAIDHAINDHGTHAIWSDGGTDWTLDNYAEATAAAHNRDNECCEDGETCALYLNEPVYYDGGNTIHRYNADGTIGEVILRRSITPE
jgi:hypothetical protein